MFFKRVIFNMTIKNGPEFEGGTWTEKKQNLRLIGRRVFYFISPKNGLALQKGGYKLIFKRG